MQKILVQNRVKIGSRTDWVKQLEMQIPYKIRPVSLQNKCYEDAIAFSFRNQYSEVSSDHFLSNFH